MQIYVVVADIWDDLILFLSKTHALEYSIKNPTVKIEIFTLESDIHSGYTPEYCYYINGEYVDSMKAIKTSETC